MPRGKSEKAEKPEKSEGRRAKSEAMGVVTSEEARAAREKALTGTMDEIAKRFGSEAVMKLGADYAVQCDAISTGSLALDAAVGVGGVPRGRIVEFYGPESSGKTTLALHVVANAQRSGGIAAFIDAEHALDPTYARKLGVDLDNLLVSQPDSGEQALEICELLVRSSAVDVIVIDSVAALVPQAELEGEMGQNHVGLQARLMSQGLRKLAGIVKKSNACIVFINQIRMKIGVMFGSPETTTGGNALKFYSSLRLDIRRVQSVKKGDEAIGNEVRVKVVKNKVAPPFRTAMFEILFNQGVNRLGELVDLGVKTDVLGKSGNWMSFGEARIGNGRDKAVEFLQANEDVREAVEAKVREALFQTSPAPAKEENADDAAGVA